MSELKEQNDLLIYKDENDNIIVDAIYKEETLWLTQKGMSKVFDCTTDNISYHLKNVFKTKELKEDSVTEESLVTASDGKNYKTKIYNLDAIIAVGYRINSKKATNFRIWATKVLKDYMIKGFALNDERFIKGNKHDAKYFDELLERIKTIRVSERMAYQKITDLFIATSTDYNPKSEEAYTFFKIVQNKLHYAVPKAQPELIHERVDTEKPYVGMTNFKGDYVTIDDVKIAKNYLSEIELQRLNLLVSQFLDYAELQALELRPMKMSDWVEELDNQILLNRRKVLEGKGKISHEEAIKKAEKEFALYREREMRELQSDFDLMMKSLPNSNET